MFRILVVALCLAVPHLALGAQCNDGVDNDGDGHVDYPADPNCYAADDDGEAGPSVSAIGWGEMPSLQDEKDAYAAWGWTWTSSDEPNLTDDTIPPVHDAAIHYDTEGDNLWTFLMMYVRTGQPGYLARARTWATYFKGSYRNQSPCPGSPAQGSYCFDRNVVGFLDHLYGWGLVSWYEFTGDPDALAEAERLGADAEALWRGGSGNLPAPGTYPINSLRKVARHLKLFTRLAAVTNDARWIGMRDWLTNVIIQSPVWDARGMYFLDQVSTDHQLGSGSYASGYRIQSTFQITLLAEALYRVLLDTGRQDVRDRLVAMARYIEQYGMDPTYDYATSWFGFHGATPWYNYSASEPIQFWDPAYTGTLVNTLAIGAKLTGDSALYERAKHFFDRGTKARSNGPGGGLPTRITPDDEVDHFLDSRMNGDFPDQLYFQFNHGELVSKYLLFDPALRGPGNVTPPEPPANLTVH